MVEVHLLKDCTSSTHLTLYFTLLFPFPSHKANIVLFTALHLTAVVLSYYSDLKGDFALKKRFSESGVCPPH